MRTIDRLETYIKKYIERYNGLRLDCDRVLNDSELAKERLKKAQETIRELQETIGQASVSGPDDTETERLKKEIIQKLHSIITRLDTLP